MVKYLGILIGIIALAYGGWLLITPKEETPPPQGVGVRTQEIPTPLPIVTVPEEPTPPQPMLQLTSTAFENGGRIPTRYTCDGENINPPLAIAGVPEGTQTLALVMDDHDVPRSIRTDGVWDHWVVFNISPETTSLGEGKRVPGTYGVGTNKKASYLGPCPPDREHRYSFHLYALDTVLGLTAGATKDQVIRAMEGHVIEETELSGRYERK